MGLKANKEEVVAFNQVMDAFDDEEVMSRIIPHLSLGEAAQMERQNDTLWLPEPYIDTVEDGIDQTANFGKTKTQLSVPARIGYKKSVPFTLDALALRDAVQQKRLGESARQALGSQVNVDVIDRISLLSTIIVPRTGAATGYSDIGAIDVAMDEVGIERMGRKFALSSRDWINASGELASREYTANNGATMDAYRRSQLGEIAGMTGIRLPYAKRLLAAAGGATTISTLDGALNYYIPVALETTGTDEIRNKDNRYQVVTTSDLAGKTIRAGDAFTIAGVYAVHHITKQPLDTLKPFRVISADIANDQLTICPPIISNQVPSDASEQYQNCYIAVADKGAAKTITWLNTQNCYVNPFWHDKSVRLIPGRYALPSDAGMQVLRGTTRSGLELVMTKQASINDLSYKYRFDLMYGIAVLQPEMVGALLFGQT